MKNNLLRFNKAQKYLFFDFETEGLNLKFSRPWQLSFLVAERGKISLIEDLWIDWPKLKVSPDAARITGFSYEKYNEKKKPAKPILSKFEKYLYDEDYLIVGQNLLGFDVDIHSSYRGLCGKSPDFSYLDRVLDTRALAMAKGLGIKSFSSDPSERILEMYKLIHHRDRKIKVSQAFLLKDLGIEFDEKKLHDAKYDIEKNFEIFQKLLWEVEV
jgi:DNA polymerase III epsilon subunit-like protein